MSGSLVLAPPRRRVRRIRLASSMIARLLRGQALARRVARALGWRRCAWTVLTTVVACAVAAAAIGATGEAGTEAAAARVAARSAAAADVAPSDRGADPVAGQVPRSIIVQRGDTLWEIAAGIVRPGEDIRAVIERLRRLNHLPGAALVEGQVLRLSR